MVTGVADRGAAAAAPAQVILIEQRADVGCRRGESQGGAAGGSGGLRRGGGRIDGLCRLAIAVADAGRHPHIDGVVSPDESLGATTSTAWKLAGAPAAAPVPGLDHGIDGPASAAGGVR